MQIFFTQRIERALEKALNALARYLDEKTFSKEKEEVPKETGAEKIFNAQSYPGWFVRD